jgi:rubredoxin
MKKINRPCWKDTVRCKNGETMDVFFSVTDFYEGDQLFICPGCGAIFAISPDEEYYSGKDFNFLKNELFCPECNNGLKDVLPYPENYWCSSTGRIEHYARTPNALPPSDTSVIVEFWNPLS